MDDVGAEISRRKARVEQAQRNRLKAEHDRDVARAAVHQAVTSLREEFDVLPEGVAALEKQLESQLEAGLAEADKALAEAGL